MSDPFGWYHQSGGIPHFTIQRDGTIDQHYDTNEFSRALLNLPGGVQTNLDQAIQIEIVNIPMRAMTMSQRTSIAKLTDWFHTAHPSIPRRWIGQRPPAQDPYASGRPGWRMSFSEWNDGTGHCGHSDVPENDHWDPGWIDADWAWFIGMLEFPIDPQPISDPEPEPVQEKVMNVVGKLVDGETFPNAYMFTLGGDSRVYEITTGGSQAGWDRWAPTLETVPGKVNLTVAQYDQLHDDIKPKVLNRA